MSRLPYQQQQQRQSQWIPLGNSDPGVAAMGPLGSDPGSPAERGVDWQQHNRYPSDQTTTPFPPYVGPRHHVRSRSNTTQADVEMLAFREEPRLRSATQPELPLPPIPAGLPRYPTVGPLESDNLAGLDPVQQALRSRSGSASSRIPLPANPRAPLAARQESKMTPSRPLTRLSESYETANNAQHASPPPLGPLAPYKPPAVYTPAQDSRTNFIGLEEDGCEDPRVRALVDAMRLNAPTPATQETRRPAEPARQSSHIELATILDDISTNPQRWSNSASPLRQEARLSEQHRRASAVERRVVPLPLQVSPGMSDTGATAAGSAVSTTRGWEKQDVSYTERQGTPLPTMGDDGGRGGGVANARNKPAGAADDFETDKDIVTWNGPDDPANPANWPMMKKYRTSLILSLFSFIAPFSATMVGPAMEVIGAELNIAPGTEQQLIQGMQVLAAGIGPFFIAPVIELFGRANVIRYAHLWHLIWNTACGFATSGPQLLAFRFIGGLGASAPQILAPGLTADVYPAPMGGRGDAVHAYLPFFGSAIAPIFGAFVTQESNWRWIFWGTSIVSVIALVLAFLVLDETYHPVLLEREAARLRKETGNQRLHTPFHDPNQSNRDRILKRAAVPWYMLVSHPIVQLPFGYRAYLFGIMYFVISTYDRNFIRVYGMDKGTASLNFLSLGIGFVVGLHISRYAIDGFSAYFRRKYNTTGHRPEWRLPVNGGAALFLPPALILYGWGLRNGLHYIIINISAFFLAIGLILGFFSLQPYVTESYGLEYAASAHSVGAFLQHIAEFAFPLFGPSVTNSDLGFGWSYTLLAALTLAICTMMPLILWHFGPAIRRISTKGLPVEPSGRR